MHDNNDDTIDILHCWQVVVGKWKSISCIVAVITSLTAAVSMFLPKMYTATATIMPISVSGGGGLAALTGQLGGLGSLMGLGGMSATPISQFMALLKTRTLAEQIIRDCNLLPVFFPNELERPSLVNEAAVKMLLGHAKFQENKKDSVIAISAEFRDPKLAADVANKYVVGLQGFIYANSFTVSKRNRVFIGKQLEENKRALLEAGKELNEFYRKNKISSVESYVDVPIVRVESYRAMQPQAENGPDEVFNLNEHLKKGLEKLQNKRGELESVLQRSSAGEDFLPNPATMPVRMDISSTRDEDLVKKVPQQVYLQYLTLHRDLLTQINSLLMQQYEMAKINESKDELVFQIIDAARVPEQRSWPKRRSMTVSAFMLSLFLSVFGAILLDYMQRFKGTWHGQRN